MRLAPDLEIFKSRIEAVLPTNRPTKNTTRPTPTALKQHCSPSAESQGRRSSLLSVAALATLLQSNVQSCYADEPEIPLRKHISKTLSAPRMFLLQRLRADGGSKILAPIRASRRRLQEAERTLRTINIYDPNPGTYKRALQSIRAASMNCYSFEMMDNDSIETRASLFQKRIGFGDACTYRLIARNVTNLLTQSQLDLKRDTLKSLNELINSYQLLDDMVDRARESDPAAIERIPDLLQFTIAHVDSFETYIERCLDIPVSNLAPTNLTS